MLEPAMTLVGTSAALHKLALKRTAIAQVAMKRGLTTATGLLRGGIAESAPRGRTGRLARAIVADVRKDPDGFVGLVGATSGPSARADAFYGKFVELGTSEHAAHPFMAPKTYQMADQLFGVIKDELAREANK